MNKVILQDKENLKPIDILLVEDNEADIRITELAFEEEKIRNRLFVCRNGEEALDYMYNRGKYKDRKKCPRPDLILLDLNMPKIDGHEVLKTLKSDKLHKSVPIVMLTSSANERDIAMSYKDGATTYIQKPIAFDDFVEVIKGFNYYWATISKLPKKDEI